MYIQLQDNIYYTVEIITQQPKKIGGLDWGSYKGTTRLGN